MSSLPLRRVSDNPRVTRSRDSSQPPSSAVLDDAAHKFSFPNSGRSMEKQRRSAQVKPNRYVEQRHSTGHGELLRAVRAESACDTIRRVRRCRPPSAMACVDVVDRVAGMGCRSLRDLSLENAVDVALTGQRVGNCLVLATRAACVARSATSAARSRVSDLVVDVLERGTRRDQGRGGHGLIPPLKRAEAGCAEHCVARHSMCSAWTQAADDRTGRNPHAFGRCSCRLTTSAKLDLGCRVREAKRFRASRQGDFAWSRP